MPQVSVVIPVYNIEAHLRQCLDSVAGQTLSDLEVVCVDDGSTDASPAILEEYAQKDPRFQVIRQANAGPGAARNRGMERSSGRYLIFLDSDDWFEPDFLERMTARAEETGADVTICRADEFDTHSGQVYDGSWMLKTQLLPGAVFSPQEAAGAVFQFTYGWPWDKLYRRDYILKEKFRYPDLAVSQDLVFVYPSVFCAGRIAVLDRVLIHHRVNRLASVSNSRSKTPESSSRIPQYPSITLGPSTASSPMPVSSLLASQTLTPSNGRPHDPAITLSVLSAGMTATRLHSVIPYIGITDVRGSASLRVCIRERGSTSPVKEMYRRLKSSA